MVESWSSTSRDELRRHGSVLRAALYLVFTALFAGRAWYLDRPTAAAVAALLLVLAIVFLLRLRKQDRGSIVGPMLADMVVIVIAAWEADLAPYSAVPFLAALLVSAYTLGPEENAKKLLLPAALVWTALSARRLAEYGVSATTLIETAISGLGMLALFRYLPVASQAITAAMEEKDRRMQESTANAEMQRKFTSMVSHELRSPLTAITGFAEVLLDPEVELREEDRVEFLRMIHGQSLEMDRLLEDILVSMRLDAGKLVYESTVIPVDKKVREVLAATPDLRGRLVTADIPIGINALGDPLRFGQIIRNLVGNACKHGGPNVRVAAVRNNGRVVVSVEDDGAGVLPEVLDSLFGEFEQGAGESSRLGFGLGLGIAQRLAHGMGGDLWHETPEKGARFCVALPAA